MFARASRNSAGEPEAFPDRQKQPNSDDVASVAHLAALGLKPGASWGDIEDAYASLVSDLTPGPGANHSRVKLARKLLDEVHAAFQALSDLPKQDRQQQDRQQKDTVA